MDREIPRISFILPARNEERFIGTTLESIEQYCPRELLHEVIVADHGSTDRTRDIAKAHGATVIQPAVQTIGALRNRGVELSTGNVIVFLDADVALTDAWRDKAPAVIDRVLNDGPPAVSGSNCATPESDNWFLKYWFSEMASDRHAQSLGTAHMIMTRAMFDQLHGFDETLTTGEDSDLCVRARGAGAAIDTRPSLRVIHYGYPVTVRAFLRRERWHGTGDTSSVAQAVRSKVVWMTLAFLGLHAMIIAGLFVAPKLALVGLVGLLLELYVSARVRFPTMRAKAVLPSMALFYLYYFGRTLSFVPPSDRGAR